MTGDFNPEQKRYLEGFVAGAQIAKAAKNVASAGTVDPVALEPTGPDADHLRAQDRVLKTARKTFRPREV